MKIKGNISKIIYENIKNNYYVIEFVTEDDYFIATGYIPIITEETIELIGDFINHEIYGEQFKIDSVDYETKDEQDIYNFLIINDLPGIGKKTARRIVDKFKEETLDILKDDIYKLTEIKGITKKRVDKLKDTIKELFKNREQILFLTKFGIKAKYQTKIIKKYGESLVETISENPYILYYDIESLSFKKVDEIAKSLSIEDNSDIRREALIFQKLKENIFRGNSYMDINILKSYFDYDIDSNISSLELAGYIKVYDEKVFFLYVYRSLLNISYNLKRINESQNEWNESLYDYALKHANIKFAEEQKDSIKAVIKNSLTIITGGPGTGKTTLIKAITDIANESNKEVKLTAPTGRASKVISDFTNHDASTIHRLLEYQPDEFDNLSFQRDFNNPLEADIVVVDEVSMVDIFLFEKLLDAIDSNTKLVLIGDYKQLPSIGPGKIFEDLIESNKFSVFKLQTIFRQSKTSLIPLNAKKIVEGKKEFQVDKEGDFFIFNNENNLSSKEIIKDLIMRRLPKAYNFNPLEDIQVLSPMKKGAIGTKELNEYIQSFLNDEEDVVINGRKFRVNDKIIMTKNNYSIEWYSEDEKESKAIFNGEIGVIISINKREKKVDCIFEGLKHTELDFDDFENIDHAYAITVHKAQGSQYKCIILAMDFVPKILASRELVYTSLTRAKELFIFVGKYRYFLYSLDIINSERRFSALKYFL